MTAVLEAERARQAVRPALGAVATARCPGPARARRRAGRPQRSRQDDAAASRGRSAEADLGHDRGARRPAGREPGAAGQGRLRRPGHADLREPVRRRPPHASAPSSTPAGTPSWPSDRIERARPRPGPAGRQALRRPARPAGADPRDREAARAADPGRAGREPRPAGPARVPADLMEVVAEHDVSVVLSSHLVADLERVCDYLIVLVASRVQVAGEVEELLASHHRLTGPRRDPATLPAQLAGDRGQPHRPAEHAAGAHRRPDPRPGLDRRAGQHGRPGARPT